MNEDILNLLKKNEVMKSIFLQISKGEIPQEDWKNEYDTLGFSALHYALFFKNEKLLKRLLDRKFFWHTRSSYFEFARNNIYDIVVLAEWFGFNWVDDIFMKVSYEARTISRTIKLEKLHIVTQETVIKKYKQLERSIRKNINVANKQRNYSQSEHLSNTLYEIMDKIRDLEIELCDIRENVEEFTKELDNLLNQNRMYRKQKVAELKKSKNTIDIEVKKIFENPYIILKIFELKLEAWCLYKIDEMELVLPKYWLGNNQSDTFNESINNKRYIKKYGKSWFSQEAHKSREVLKKEFRELGKIYHPDNFKHPDSTKIFQDILSERMNILETMN